jgi:hypothetical protein
MGDLKAMREQAAGGMQFVHSKTYLALIECAEALIASTAHAEASSERLECCDNVLRKSQTALAKLKAAP